MLNLMLMLTDEVRAMRKENFIINVNLNGFFLKKIPLRLTQLHDGVRTFQTPSALRPLLHFQG